MDSSLSLGMTTKGMLGMHHLVMLNEAQRSEASILVSSLSLGMTTKGMLGYRYRSE
jgi:hypothetical protein